MIEQYFNPAQQEVNLISARDNVVVGGRGIGKSILHATFNLRNMQRMPGSNGGFVSANTKRCLTNTIPSMLQHWERWGFHRGKHYVIGIKPPKKLGWPDPVIPPSNWENTISFYNGSIGTIISQDRKGTSAYMPSADSKRLGCSWHNCVPRLSFTRSTHPSIMSRSWAWSSSSR